MARLNDIQRRIITMTQEFVPPPPPPYASKSPCWEINLLEDQKQPPRNVGKQARPPREMVGKASEGFSDRTLQLKGRFLASNTTPIPPSPIDPPISSPSPPPPSNLPPSPPPPSNPSPSPPPPSNPSPSNPTPSDPSPSNPSSSNSPPSNPSPTWTPNQSSPSPTHHSSFVSAPLIVGVAAGGVVLVLLLTLFCVFCWRKKRRVDEGVPMHYGEPLPPAQQSAPYRDDRYGGQYELHMKFSSDPQPKPPLIINSEPVKNKIINSDGSDSNKSNGGDQLPPMNGLTISKSTFTYEELLLATKGFPDSGLLGQGGFGYVHKGVLPNGKEIAVKQLKRGSSQGEREFQAEVEIISRVHHKHLVSLVGYCVSAGQRLLVYEFVPNNTLEFHLHGKGRPTMDWPTRMTIALGAAKGLAYLHEDCHPKIIHRDIKASNILLDYKFEAKVADFGLAKLTSDNNTHVSTRVMGTFGYMAPEYASSGQLTEKSDVFSFGVMLLELITGRRPVDISLTDMEDSLVDWAKPLIVRAQEEGNYEQLLDPRLGNNLNANEVMRVINCAAACVRSSARRRPRMSQVIRSLEGDVSREEITRAAMPINGSSDNDSSHYSEDMNKFRTMGLQSNEYQSSLYSVATTESGKNPYGSSSNYKFGSQGY